MATNTENMKLANRVGQTFRRVWDVTGLAAVVATHALPVHNFGTVTRVQLDPLYLNTASVEASVFPIESAPDKIVYLRVPSGGDTLARMTVTVEGY